MKRAAVIGSGLGGLSAALHLTNSGQVQVDLYESADQLGGKAGTLRLGDYRFDTGPTLLTMSFVLEQLFEECGRSLSDYLDLKALPVHCRYSYYDGSSFSAFTDGGLFLDEIARFSPGSDSKMERYLAHCQRIWDAAAQTFIFSPFLEWSVFRKLGPLKGARIMRHIDSGRSMHRANSAFFDDPRLIQFADRYATFNGSSPYRAPATLNVIQHAEQMGVSLPAAGIYGITEALGRLAPELGVRIHTSTPVEGITLRHKRVTGVRTADAAIDYDFVVSNCDVRRTYDELLEDQSSWAARKYRALPLSSSALVFYWGVDLQTELDPHTILFSHDYRAEFGDIFSRQICPRDPTIYIYISSKIVPGDSPAGRENWYVMINAPGDSGQDWDAEIAGVRRQVLNTIRDRLDIDLEKHIEEEAVQDPRTIARRTGSFAGSLYGPSSNTKIAAFLRQPNRSHKYHGLYFCGGSAHPGGGIPMVLLSGKMAADAACEREL